MNRARTALALAGIALLGVPGCRTLAYWAQGTRYEYAGPFARPLEQVWAKTKAELESAFVSVEREDREEREMESAWRVLEGPTTLSFRRWKAHARVEPREGGTWAVGVMVLQERLFDALDLEDPSTFTWEPDGFDLDEEAELVQRLDFALGAGPEIPARPGGGR